MTIKPLLIFLFILSFKSYGGGPIHIIQQGEEIPNDRFIFMIRNIVTGEVVMGYSKKEHDINSPKPKGVRNGGHLVLLAHALGVDEADFDSLYHAEGRRLWMGGGFYKDSNGFTYMHPFNSNNANGSVYKGQKVIGILNPDTVTKKNSVRRARTSIIPREYASDFYQKISELTGQPLRIDPNFLDSKRMPLNKLSHPDLINPRRRERFLSSAVFWMEATVGEVNQPQMKKIKRLNSQCLVRKLKELRR
jgi:hypothetical protein